MVILLKCAKGVGGITRKGMRVQKLLLERIEREEYPISTRQLALALQLSWHTVQEHCFQLQLNKKISGFRIAGSYLWTKKEAASKKDDARDLLRTLLDEQLNQEVNSAIQKLQQEIAFLKQEAVEKEALQKEDPPKHISQKKPRESRISAQFVAGGVNNVE